MSKPKSVDRRVEALEKRLVKAEQAHAQTVAAKNRELRALRDRWELLDTFPALEDFLSWLHKVRDAGSTLKATSYEVRGSGVSDPTGTSAAGQSPDRSRVESVNRDLEYWTGSLRRRLSPKGPLVDEEIPDVSKPRCFNPECPARLVPQGFDQVICYECKIPFTEFREVKAGKRCWIRECPFYGKTQKCVHVQ